MLQEVIFQECNIQSGPFLSSHYRLYLQGKGFLLFMLLSPVWCSVLDGLCPMNLSTGLVGFEFISLI